MIIGKIRYNKSLKSDLTKGIRSSYIVEKGMIKMRTPKEAILSRSRAAGMASATKGRARVFADKKNTPYSADSEIEEGVQEYEEKKRSS